MILRRCFSTSTQTRNGAVEEARGENAYFVFSMEVGGGGGFCRYSITHQTASTTIATMIVATILRVREGGVGSPASDMEARYSESVSMRSARLKSSSVRPPLLWVDRTSRTLLKRMSISG